MKDTIITLYINTTEIIKLTNKKADREAVLSCTLLADNHYDIPKEEEFVSRIHKNSKLAWVGAAMHILENDQDFVIIKKILLKKKKSMIKIYDSKNGAGATHIDGHVGKVKVNSQEEYSIKFKVNSGGQEKTFTIDPKIRVI